MNRFTNWLVKRYIRDYQDTGNLVVRARYGSLEGWISIIGNTILFIIKIMVGLSINSIALIADAVHTLSDSATSIVIILGFKIAKKPSDKEHPFGHGRMESIATLIVAVLLFVAGFELLQQSVSSLFNPHESTAGFGAIIIITLTILVKELMSRFAFVLGEMIDSKALMADALHHRSDVFATALVVISMVASRWGFFWVDGVMGGLVSAIIFYSAYTIAKEAIDPLLGEAPSLEMLKEIEKLAKSQEGVIGVHDIIVHKYGFTNIISLHIEVSDSDTPANLHDISEKVEVLISQVMGGAVTVHIDPLNTGHPYYQKIHKAMEEIVAADKRITAFHDLRIVGQDKEKCTVVFDLVLENATDLQENYNLVSSFKDSFKQQFPFMKLAVQVESEYAFNI